MKQFDAIIIGAGPAGMMAAIHAAEKNRHILLIERNNTPGKKLLISGKGRCNLTNSCDIADFISKFSESRNFLRNAFAKFFNTDLLSFFEEAGLELKKERGGRVFPKSDKSNDVLNTLNSKLKNKNIKILLNERVREVIVKDKQVEGVITYSNKHFLAKHITIATGGLSYPETGSTGDGYNIAAALGHQIVPLKQALAPILIKEKFIKDWQGISLKNVSLSLYANGKKIDERFGEMIFTHFGLSGPVVLDLSAAIYDAMEVEPLGLKAKAPSRAENKIHSSLELPPKADPPLAEKPGDFCEGLKSKVELCINFKPALDNKILDARLLREFKANSRKSIKNIFKNLLPQGIIMRFLEYCNVDADKSANQITTEERKKLINGLFELRVTVEGVMPIKDGIVTRGGVNTKEINPQTMESKLIKGLFFAGEVIDIDAKTGGYNMQAAFSTGWVCGDNI